jgi:hypothetical protein
MHRDLIEGSLYDGLMKNILLAEFLLDVSLMCDALQEFSELLL